MVNIFERTSAFGNVSLPQRRRGEGYYITLISVQYYKE